MSEVLVARQRLRQELWCAALRVGDAVAGHHFSTVRTSFLDDQHVHISF